MSALIDRIAAQAEREPERVVPVLHALLGDDVRMTESLRPVAGRVRAGRRESALEAFTTGALTTEQVRERLGVATPQAVHQMRRRGRILGRTIGNATYHPAWQLGEAGLRDRLGEILAAIMAFTSDAVAADRIMRSPREELGGRSIDEALDEPAVAETAWRLLHRLGGGF